MLDVIPTEIRYWKADGKLAYLASVAKSALSSEPGSPGKLIVVTQDEVSFADGKRAPDETRRVLEKAENVCKADADCLLCNLRN